MKFGICKHRKIYISLLLYSLITVLNGCSDLVLLHPRGQIGMEERSLILTAFGLMLSIVVPVIVMTIFFTIKYRASNLRNTQYSPNWVNSKEIEFIVWAVPILIIIFLGTVTWKSTHKLDPKNPIVSSTEQPIIINVISLDWKWLFIYPKQNIAVVNELVFPAHIPIKFNVTSNSVMNSFFIPQLGGQIYAMAGMRTELYLIANAAGRYKGISSNFSGQGFSGMKFTVVATQTKQEFEQWIQKARKSSHQINNMSIYEELAKPSEYHPIIYFSNVQPNLFYNVINKFTHQKKEYF
ncbi:cytochrome o ubiquinol oxidase, subunit II [Candidatus Blochmanniella pennsylvanica str. BPEN]|uniref:Ubiquinol oxidase subunit 2 n=1 Tax=Blochmanniella pennsylvanica (strain BPEN) TaxID=291272 RepID=Q493F9_BLOPB|nr:ubiquinol oxidase subunit II [Candidatus Blochmannia pennsylvanicus]AAZ40883.1 cytochrome o ubiquinol oxidase, subunit II [Candidatus Blochmannia pennsylvanicus str. BPEN]UOY04645.1 ubiquinol oxidase subunit II [Candidatus Blochmannia pennsylvanicus]